MSRPRCGESRCPTRVRATLVVQLTSIHIPAMPTFSSEMGMWSKVAAARATTSLMGDCPCEEHEVVAPDVLALELHETSSLVESDVRDAALAGEQLDSRDR